MGMQFEDVFNERGAPMGRKAYGMPPAKGIRLFKVILNTGGYDDGGAYWGLPNNLYCARIDATWNEEKQCDDEYRAFVRAHNRQDAMTKLGLKPSQLKCKIGIMPEGV